MPWRWQVELAVSLCEALLLESDRAVLRLGERGEASCAPERSALYSAPLRSSEEGEKKKAHILIGPGHHVASYPRCRNRAFTLPSLRDLHQFPGK